MESDNIAGDMVEWTGTKPLGTPVTFVRHWKRDLFAIREVPCGSCTGCCRSAFDIELSSDEERARFPHVIKDGKTVILPLANGHCHYLVDDKCSVYETRPLTCRVFDCRMYAFVGVLPSNEDLPLVQAVREWAPPRMGTQDDREALVAMRLKFAATYTEGVDTTVAVALALLGYEEYLDTARKLMRVMKEKLGL